MQLTGLVAPPGAHVVPGVIHGHQMEPDIMAAHQGAMAAAAAAATGPGPTVVVGAQEAKEEDSDPKPEEDEKSKLLEGEDRIQAIGRAVPPVIHVDPPPGEAGFETEDEKAHLLSLDE